MKRSCINWLEPWDVLEHPWSTNETKQDQFSKRLVHWEFINSSWNGYGQAFLMCSWHILLLLLDPFMRSWFLNHPQTVFPMHCNV